MTAIKSTIIALAIIPHCTYPDPCAEGSNLEHACEQDETGGAPGDLGLIYPQPTFSAPEYGFRDIDHPPPGHQYSEIAWEEQLFFYSCGGAAPGVDNCAIGLRGVGVDYTDASGIGLCPTFEGTWDLPTVDPGWHAEGDPAPMTSPYCFGPEDEPPMVCEHGITCLGAINGPPPSGNYWEDCYCDCPSGADSQCPGEFFGCESGMCFPPFAAPPLPPGGPSVYGLPSWDGHASCDGDTCEISDQLARVLTTSIAISWDDLDVGFASGLDLEILRVGADSLPAVAGIRVGDVISPSQLWGAWEAVALRRPATIAITHEDGSSRLLDLSVH
jgi:hypothetical protein